MKVMRLSSRKPKTLLSEIQLLVIILSTAIIIAVEFVSQVLMTSSMINDLESKARVSADEVAAILEEPLYVIDDDHASRIGEALLASGRISGIIIKSSVTGVILERPYQGPSALLPPLVRVIQRGGMPLGEVLIEFSDIEIRKTRERFIYATVWILCAVIISNVAVMRFFLVSRVMRIFDNITEGLVTIGRGEYQTAIPLSGYGDVDTLISMVNNMSARILEKSNDLIVANNSLEENVRERTLELETSLKELERAQARLVENEKLSALGHLSAGVAHELNTPLGAIVSSSASVIEYFTNEKPQILTVYEKLNAEERAFFDLVLRSAIRIAAQPSMMLADRKRRRDVKLRLESLGLAKAEELADALSELDLYDHVEELLPGLRLPHAHEILTEVLEPVNARRMVKVIDVAARKAAAVVGALRSYISSDPDESGHIVHIDETIDTVLTLLHNRIKHGINLTLSLQGGKVKGSSDKLGQVWMNLIVNAIQAMDEHGDLIVSSEKIGENCVVKVIDSGPGISADLMDKIFMPFFTTKKSGEGLGLGLDLCRRIIEAHGGTITVESVPGRTAFQVSLPLLEP